MTITNNTTTPINNWTLSFDWDRDITQIWNAVIVSHVGDHYVIQPESYDESIAPGASLTFGFLGNSGNIGTDLPTDIVLS
jgi:hypothetical protein